MVLFPSINGQYSMFESPGAFNALMKPLAQSTKALSRFKEKPLAQPPRSLQPNQ